MDLTLFEYDHAGVALDEPPMPTVTPPDEASSDEAGQSD